MLGAFVWKHTDKPADCLERLHTALRTLPSALGVNRWYVSFSSLFHQRPCMMSSPCSSGFIHFVCADIVSVYTAASRQESISFLIILLLILLIIIIFCT